MIRIAIAATPLICRLQLGLATGCPTDDHIPCAPPIYNGEGCGTYGSYCCYYIEVRCPGSEQTYRTWTTYPNRACQPDSQQHYICIEIA